jgi:serine protease SohB
MCGLFFWSNELEFIIEYGLFLAKSVTILAAILVVIAVIFGASQRQRETEPGHIEVKNLNESLESITHSLKAAVSNPALRKQETKQEKKKAKEKQKEQKKEAKDGQESRPRLFVLDFNGDIQASEVTGLREEITAVLSIADEHDEVLVRLESPGGVVHGYGLAASQLQRIRNKSIPLTVAVDKVAASGGYMMACIANKIIAAPFSLLGSIGVVAQIPNFHRLLQKNDIDVEILTAGEYKRTLTMLGENTDKAREKFVDELEDVHELFKQFVSSNRPQVDIEKVATGEAWFGTRAIDKQLVDELKTSDEYIIDQCEDRDAFHVKYILHRNKIDKLVERVTKLFSPVDITQSNPKQFIR